jgi:hypothetical protein
MLEHFSSVYVSYRGSQTLVVRNKHFVYCMSKWIQGTISWMNFSSRLQGEDYYYEFYPLACPAIKNRTGPDLANVEASVSCILFRREKHSVNEA